MIATHPALNLTCAEGRLLVEDGYMEEEHRVHTKEGSTSPGGLE
jgi:hypothetical protein